MKSILIPMESDDSMPSALQTALLLARRFDSYIEGFALRWGVSEFVAVDAMSGIPVEMYKEDLAEATTRARQTFESFMQANQVPPARGTTGKLSCGWLEDAPDDVSFVGNYGRVFDVIVMNRPDANSTGRRNRAIESGLFESGRPILLAPPSPPQRIATNALIPWNGSTEQARATALAMPLLHGAERVTVLMVSGGAAVPGPTAEHMHRYLRQNGIAAEMLTVGLNSKSTGEAILAAADSLSCDLLIKGAYTQSRLRQMIFGGATRHVLLNAALPVLLAH